MVEPDKDAEIRELRERLSRLESAPEAATSPAPAPKARMGCGGILGAGLLICVGIGLVSMCAGGGDVNSTTGFTQTSWTPPPGFYVEPSNRSVATEWDKPTGSECRGSGVTCFAVNVVTEKGCPRNLYMSITLLDANGQNIGWTNDTAQGVLPGEKTRLVFDTYERGAESARIADISCY